jgi:MFS superfamily sulfate permease-like transporter
VRARRTRSHAAGEVTGRRRGHHAATSFRPFGSLRGYRSEWLSGDAIAGLTVWAVLVPEALAYASIAGAPPVVGLYAAPGALILYAVFGSSRHLVTGPMSATAALSAAAVAQFATAGSSEFVTLTTALAITAGVIAVIAGAAAVRLHRQLHLGPVLKGFIIGSRSRSSSGSQAVRCRKGGDFFEQLRSL